jgi:AcrR family transcriptional regulator
VGLYEEQGWAGFSFEGVAARAGIGKSALYRRWSAKEDLLADALVARTREITRVDTGSLREDLVVLGEQLLANYTAPHGLVSLRLFVEAPHHAALEARSLPRLESHQLEAQAIVSRAVERGELRPDSANDNILPALSGGLLQKVLTARGAARNELRRNRRQHAERLVDFVLLACSPAPAHDAPRAASRQD